MDDSTNQMPEFPQELIDAVIDSLGSSLATYQRARRWNHDPCIIRKYISTLKSCSLVCKDWLPRSRKHLFHQFTISVSETEHSLYWNRSRDRARAHFARRVEPLAEMDSRPSCLPPEITSLVEKLIISPETLVDAFSINENFLGRLPFTALRHIELSNEPFDDPLHFQPGFDSESFSVLLKKNVMLESLRFHYVCFPRCRDIVEMLLSLKERNSFHTLDLEWIHVKEPEWDSEDLEDLKERLRLEAIECLATQLAPSQPGCGLRVLKYRNVNDQILESLFLHPDALLDLSNLEELELYFASTLWPVNGNPALQLLTRCKSLVRLKLDVSSFVWDPPDECRLDAAPFRHLKLDFLELNSMDRIMEGSEQEHPRFVLSIFNELSCLRCLRLDLSSGSMTKELADLLDPVLSTLPAFLKEIQVNMDLDDVSRRLPRTYAKRLITVVEEDG